MTETDQPGPGRPLPALGRLALLSSLLWGLAGGSPSAVAIGRAPLRDAAGRPGSAARAERAARDRDSGIASDGRRLLTRDVTVSPSHISPGVSPRSQDSTAISYLVIAPETISVAIYLDEVLGDSLTGRFIEIQSPGTRRAPRISPYIRIFNGFVNEVAVVDGTYELTVRAADDTARVEEDRLPLEIDTKPPRLMEPLSEGNDQSMFRNGDTIVVRGRLDQPGYRVTADFSTMDSDLDPTLTTVIDQEDGRYEIHHLISRENTRSDGRDRRVQVTFRDAAGNSLVDTSLLFCLSNAPPILVSSRFLPDGAGVYRNGSTVRIETRWTSGATPLTISADFSNVDSRYDPARVAVTERAGNVFELAYEIDADNERPDRSDYRVRLTAHDLGCGTSIDTSLTVALDNQRGDAPTLIDTITATRLSAIDISGRAPGSVLVVARRGSTVLDSAEVGTDQRFTVTLPLVPAENALTIEGYDRAGNKSAALTFSIFRVTEAFVTLPARYEPEEPIRVAPSRRADRLRLELWSLSGNLVRIIEDARGGELFDLRWDGRNSGGERMNSGPLLALIHIDYQDGGSETLKRAFVLVKP